MSLVLTVALAASAASLPACTWDRPGDDPYMGPVAAAVDRYTDIPEPVRDRLKQRMAARKYDDIATIRRDTIEGKHRYAELRDMHFGRGRLCHTVTRDKWTPATVERGLVYCEATHCIIVPTVCRNVSRVTRLPKPAGADRREGDPAQAAENPLAASSSPQDADELLFDPPAAGVKPGFADAVAGGPTAGTAGLASAVFNDVFGGSPGGLASGGSGPWGLFPSAVIEPGSRGIVAGGTGSGSGASGGGSGAGTGGNGTGSVGRGAGTSGIGGGTDGGSVGAAGSGGALGGTGGATGSGGAGGGATAPGSAGGGTGSSSSGGATSAGGTGGAGASPGSAGGGTGGGTGGTTGSGGAGGGGTAPGSAGGGTGGGTGGPTNSGGAGGGGGTTGLGGAGSGGTAGAEGSGAGPGGPTGGTDGGTTGGAAGGGNDPGGAGHGSGGGANGGTGDSDPADAFPDDGLLDMPLLEGGLPGGDGAGSGIPADPASVPEPASWILLGSGLALIGLARRRRASGR